MACMKLIEYTTYPERSITDFPFDLKNEME